MSTPGKPDSLRLGFLTAIETPDKGFVGGLLVTNHCGRPLEFQCTLPVKANATQELLYGPTLKPYVLGELIGAALLDKAGIKPHLILTDCDEILEVRNHVSAPVAHVSAWSTKSDNSASLGASPAAVNATQASGTVAAELSSARDCLSPGHHGSELQSMQLVTQVGGDWQLGRHRLRFHAAHTADHEAWSKQGQRISADADLQEPFQRVREALQETLRTGGAR